MKSQPTPAQAALAQARPSKFRQLRELIASPELEFLMEAHDGMSAKIVEEAGFKGIWASGLSMSAALGVRDSNEASWTQVLEVLEFMADASSIPILVDGDTGWGNFNNMRRAVRKLGERGIAGICIEDKLFPKTNSFVGEGQALAAIDEFCGKIKAGKDSQVDDDFRIVARIEALIAGWGLEEALKRAEAYRAAGADAVLIHSKKSTADEIFAFAKAWNNRCPVVIVPTKYYATPTEAFRQAGISVAIWANHNLRAAIAAMRDASRRIRREESIAGVEKTVVSVQEVFELSGNDELAEAEKRYLPAKAGEKRAILLAASRGAALGRLTEDRPKCMIEVRGQPLLSRLIGTVREAGVREITVVRGYKKDTINFPSIATADNDLYMTTGEAASLACAIERLEGECLVAYGDILFRHHILDQLLAHPGDIVVTVDALWRARVSQAKNWVRDFAACTRAFSPTFLDDEPVHLRRIASDMPAEEISGEWMGLAKLSARGAERVREAIHAMRRDGTLAKAGLPELFTRMAGEGAPIHVLYIAGQWLDVDDAADLAEAGKFL